MDIGLAITIAVAAVGATWALRSKLGDVESALKAHAASDEANFKELTAKVIKLEGRRGRR